MTLVARRYETEWPDPRRTWVRLCSSPVAELLMVRSGTTHGFAHMSRSRAVPLCSGSPRRRPTYPGVARGQSGDCEPPLTAPFAVADLTLFE